MNREQAHPEHSRQERGHAGHAPPTFTTMTHADCDALLARNHVGRLAFSLHDRVDVQPIHYAYEPGWLYCRTSEGAKLATLEHNHWLAFEVDEVRGPFDWESVIVHGTFHRLDPEGSPRDRAAVAQGIALLRANEPDTFRADDPAGFRRVMFRISIGEVTGRRAASAPVAGTPAKERTDGRSD